MPQTPEERLAILETAIVAIREDINRRAKHAAELRAADQRALEAAKAAEDYRLDTMNEFRAQLSDEKATFANREIMEQRFQELSSELRRMATREFVEGVNREQNRVMDKLEESVTNQSLFLANLAGKVWIIPILLGTGTVGISAVVQFVS